MADMCAAVRNPNPYAAPVADAYLSSCTVTPFAKQLSDRFVKRMNTFIFVVHIRIDYVSTPDLLGEDKQTLSQTYI